MMSSVRWFIAVAVVSVVGIWSPEEVSGQRPQIGESQQPFIGEIRMFAGNFAPRGWALCDGQLLAIAANTELFTVLGTTYGGDGRTTFALPDLRGRTPIHKGKGPGLSERTIGEKAGAETIKRKINKKAQPATDLEKGVDTPQFPKSVDNMQPFLAINFIIALQGKFPSRN